MITFDARAAEKAIVKELNMMSARGRNMKPIFRSLRKPLRTSLYGIIDSQKDSNGRKWPGRSAASIARIKNARKSRTKSGRLRKAAERKLGSSLSKRMVGDSKVTVGKDFIKVTSNIPFSGVHQSGGRNGNASIPKREFFYITDKFLKASAKVMVEHVAGTRPRLARIRGLL